MKTFSTPLLQSVILNMHPMLASPPFKLCTNRGKANSDFEFHLNGIAREYQRKSHLKQIPIRDLGNVYTQPICYACGETCHVARLCPNKKVSSLDHLKKKACSRCGEEGHQASQCPGNCPNCEDNHPFGECPTSHITCFQCESSTHVPANCPINYLVSAISKIQPNNFQLAAHVVQASKKHEDLIQQQKVNIVCWECGIKGHYSNECPKKLNLAPTTYHKYPKPRNY
jgi:hypothetical protein